MPGQPTFAPPDPMVRDLHHRAHASEFGISCEELKQILISVLARNHELTDNNTSRVEEFCRSLHIEELVLARACAQGNERAREVFITRYRQKLYGFGWQIAKEDSARRESADAQGPSSRCAVGISDRECEFSPGYEKGFFASAQNDNFNEQW